MRPKETKRQAVHAMVEALDWLGDEALAIGMLDVCELLGLASKKARRYPALQAAKRPRPKPPQAASRGKPCA